MKKFKLNSDNLKDVTIDKANGVISNISLMTVGEAKGHGIHIDTKTLSLLFGLGQDKNVKSFLNHSDNHTPADAIGFFFGHYIDQATKSLRASFKALPAFMAQEKEFNTLFDLSELAPDSFGVSMVLNGGVETMEDGLEYLRPTVIESADFVCSPAANERGLFSAKTEEPVIQSVTVIETPYHFKIMKNLYTRFSTNEKSLLKAIKLAAEDPTLTEETVIQKVEDEVKAEEKASLESQVATLTASLEELKATVATLTAEKETALTEKEAVVTENTELKTKLAAKVPVGSPFVRTGFQNKEVNSPILDQYNALPQSDKMKFYRENEKELRKYFF